jgi:hypothetical protein
LVRSEYSGTRPWVISEYDAFNEELVAFQNHSSMPSTFRGYSIYKGSLFNEDENRWKGCHSFEPEMMGKLDTTLFHFKDGDVYIHEGGTDHSTFFGSKKDCYIEPVFTTKSKVSNWKTLAYVATDKWSAEWIKSEYRGLKTIQNSRVKIENFEIREDTYFSEIKNDLNTVNVSNPIIDGDAMRSKAIQVLLKLDPEVVHLSLLHYVFGGYIDSPKNP